MAQVAALILLVFGLLPIANWIPGGHDAPFYHDRLSEWLSGGAISLGVGIMAAILLGKQPALWREGAWARLAARWREAGRRGDGVVAMISFGICAVAARTVLSARPLLIDEVIQLFQARVFASGRWFMPAAAHPEFTSAMHLLDWNGKVYGQFPAGGPAMLAIGVLLHAAWLVGPVATALGVYCFARLLRRIETRNGTALAALLLYALAPFVVFLGGSMMNHVTATSWLIAAALALAIATADDDAHVVTALGMGLALGVAATIRPSDAAAFALPSAAWLLWRAMRGRGHLVALVASGVGVAIPVGLMLLVNAHQTGHALRFGYIEMWGASHEIGFHPAPWGPAHTPARGIELINIYFLRLQDYFFEAAGPSLLFATFALGLSRRLRGYDRWILAGCGMLVLAYFAYWHNGFYLGPRFMLPLAPWIALWTARLPAVLRDRDVAPAWVAGTVVAGCTALAIGLFASIPLRVRQYQGGMLSMRIDADSAAAANGVQHAVILVRESWGAQLLARMWAAGVSRADAEHLYRTNDACHIERALSTAEATADDSTTFRRALRSFGDDSARLITISDLPDTTVRFNPNQTLPTLCSRRLMEDRAGFALFPAVMLATGHDNLFIRDLHARDSLVSGSWDGRAIWLLTKSPVVGSPLRFERVSLDSMHHEWQAASRDSP